MGSNSIKDNLTKEDIVSDIILSMGADIEGINVYILVEGESDICLIHPYLTDNVIIYESYDGKNGVEYIVGFSFSNNERVIGIRDRDYQLKPISPKMFYYDYGCMEMMVVYNDDVFGKLCFEYYRGDLSSRELKKYIFEQLRLLSIIRFHNERDQWGITLKGVSINAAWKKNQGALDNGVIVDKINAMNNNYIDEMLAQKLKEETVHEWSETDNYYYTQGHDFFTMFTLICNQNKKGRGIKDIEVEASARCAFRWGDMIKTSLYQQIIEYEKEMGLSIIRESI